ncbi:hypothetical protein NDU88_002802 [Pleurodeles waltl]|uniref:Uncharacterized protein n=1 Tax=Pleurodeles waltl TaxID=8319 RepID=A0AAV7W371_PLEWA|nr:hypothetical protein NDU88_002802 [Pleurodeles waltl]
MAAAPAYYCDILYGTPPLSLSKNRAGTMEESVRGVECGAGRCEEISEDAGGDRSGDDGVGGTSDQSSEKKMDAEKEDHLSAFNLSDPSVEEDLWDPMPQPRKVVVEGR